MKWIKPNKTTEAQEVVETGALLLDEQTPVVQGDGRGGWVEWCQRVSEYWKET